MARRTHAVTTDERREKERIDEEEEKVS